jgi:endonuclease YncB( thermonuclease family)
MCVTRRGCVALAVLALGMSVVVTAHAAPIASPARLARVVDGDTIVLAGGARVRLLQIDTPEPGTGECYSRAATRDLRRLLPAGSPLALERDPRLDEVDAYGRLLRYVWRRGVNVNLQLVRDGSATVWLYHGERGKYAERLLAAGRAARAAKRGLWGACPRAVWNPYGPATTGGGSGDGTLRPAAGGGCDPSYPDVCIPPPPPDLDCADIPYRNFRVRPPDPHRFDGEGDGLGCES